MTPERQEAIERICLGALEREGSARQRWLTDACAGDAALLSEVQGLLRHEATAARALSRPALEAAAEQWADRASELRIGQPFGDFAIVSHLGRGGMGEVYRARDTTLRRDVAIKVLPRAFTGDADRLARFQREARVLAALNHPHIGAIYGVEDVEGGPALVLEFVDGETLAERIARGTQGRRGGLPVVEVLRIARQIAAALEAAHERGIIHRDLKPANIKLRPDGTVKVLDFGLAKAVGDGEGFDESHGPTLGVGSTEPGLVLGTAAYMSPEQARGLKVDKRTDIWAFGCVVYEMLTGRMAFAGDTRTDVLAAVLHREPDWQAVPGDAGAAVRLVLRRCLEKDPTDRVRDMGDVQLALSGAFTPEVLVTASRPSAWGPLWLPVAAALIGGLLAGAVFLIRSRPVSAPVTTLSLNIRPALSSPHNLTITPDGSRIVYVADNGRQLLVRALDTFQPLVIATGEVLTGPFTSPDGLWVGFFESGTMTGGNSPGASTLKRVPATGGVPITVAALQGTPSGATWLPDDTIVFAAGYGRRNLQRIPTSGGTPTVLIEPNAAENELSYRWPQRLAGGGAVLFTIRARSNGSEAARIALYDLRTRNKKILLSGGSDAQEVASSHLVYVAAGGLWALPFDSGRQETIGVPTAVLPQGLSTAVDTGTFAVASNGTLVYATAAGGAATRTLLWVDRDGHEQPLAPARESYLHPRLSHDGTRIAASVSFGRGATNIGVWDLSRGALTRVNTEAALEVSPVWTPDDRWILFTSNRDGGTANIWRQLADGTGSAERLMTSASRQSVTSLSPDGAHLVFQEYTPARGWDVMQLALDATRRIEPLVQTSFDEDNAVLSPDGRWLAYESNSSGQLEVYVQPYPNPGGARWKVSTAGGTAPAWPRTGKELFFLALDESLMSVPILETGTTWSAGVPTTVLQPGYYTAGGNIGRQYEVSPDGKRFIMIKSSTTAAVNPEVVVVQHWDQELRTRVPVK